MKLSSDNLKMISIYLTSAIISIVMFQVVIA
ncbi:hypothetical protein theurythT_09990 [Thalassotalea eurytherma]|uniref:Uncharacterized protein n=1 Tax=Thalassotalea eurytherma TaxID=1144278 RepID=A0ABQ6H1V2_9GAMM|nr:hypothetical protein theurythT_09990 [Thalassotalea eurytherma]